MSVSCVVGVQLTEIELRYFRFQITRGVCRVQLVSVSVELECNSQDSVEIFYEGCVVRVQLVSVGCVVGAQLTE